MPRPILLNTRPKDAKSLTLQGVDSLPLPLLCLKARELTADDRAVLEQFLTVGVDVLTVVSQTAVGYFLGFLKDQGIHHASELPHIPPIVVAVGEPTADALRAFGFDVIVPEQMNNEGMLALPQIKTLAPKARVLICKGVGGRQVYADGLTKLGMNVLGVDWYTRHTPDELADNFKNVLNHFKALNDKPILFIPITSQMSLNAWHHIQADRLLNDYKKVYLPLGERLQELTHNLYPHAKIQLIHRLDSEYLSKVIEVYHS